MNSAIILAGGVGERFNDKIPKQFLKIDDKQLMIEYSIDKFSKNDNIDDIILVVHKDWFNLIDEKYKNYKVVVGGDNRFFSSYIGLKQCSKNSKYVFIHDAARPFISNNLINDGLKFVKDNDAAIPILDINESVIYQKRESFDYINRDKVKIIQTPQVFKFEIIKDAYEYILQPSTKSDISSNFTDDLSVLMNYYNEINNLKLREEEKNFNKKHLYSYIIFYKGCVNNIKVTYNDDLKNLNFKI